MKRCEDPRLVTGNGSCVSNLMLPDMLHVAVLRSQHATQAALAALASSLGHYWEELWGTAPALRTLLHG